MAINEYKCPCCGGSIEFNSKTQKMKCPYCDVEFDVNAVEDTMNEHDNSTEDEFEWQPFLGTELNDEESKNMRLFTCKSCGGEIVGDVNTGATSCPYCGNNVVVADTFKGILRPDIVIPFKLDKDAAKEELKKHLCGKILLPKVFKDENHINEVKGIYVPYWLFNADANANIHFHGTKVSRWSDREYSYTDTKHYSVRRSGSLKFANVPVDGSSKMPDDLMESIEPFNLKDGVDFNTAYLAGYLADKYDVSAEASEPRANERIRQSTIDSIRNTIIGYDTLLPSFSNIQLNGRKIKYALYPVWIINTTWRDNKYTFAMNGQTGKFVGDLPEDKAVAAKITAGIIVIGTALIFGAQYLAWLLK